MHKKRSFLACRNPQKLSFWDAGNSVSVQSEGFSCMSKLTKYDVLLYLSQMESPEKEELVKFLKRNIFFGNVSERAVSERLKELKEEKLIEGMKINLENPKTANCLAFLYWSKMKGKDYNKYLEEKSVSTFKMLFEKGVMKLKALMKETSLSKPTALKYVRLLEEGGFIAAIKGKPLILKANLNDLTFFYINFLGLGFKKFEELFEIPSMPNMRSKKLAEMLVRIHAYSTTVTEGNTATEKDVEKIFGDYPVSLAPREVLEIINARAAIEGLFSISKNDIDLFQIKRLHKILMNNLIDNAGEFYYGNKKIAGFPTKLPYSKQEIDYAMGALLNFCKNKISPQIQASIAHFIFASIHPFADGNGRIARLIHSWILLKNGLPLFVFDPNRRNEYFSLLEKARSDSVEDFMNFCIREHYASLEKIKREAGSG